MIDDTLRDQIADTVGVPQHLREFITADTPEGAGEQAAKLARAAQPVPKPDPSQGPKPTSRDSWKDADSHDVRRELRRRGLTSR